MRSYSLCRVISGVVSVVRSGARVDTVTAIVLAVALATAAPRPASAESTASKNAAPDNTAAITSASNPSDPLMVVVDIPFVASLVRELTGPDAVITTLVSANDSPHTFSLRPRAVRDVQKADLVVIMSPALSPNIARAMDNVSTVRAFNLSSAQGIAFLPSRGQQDHRPSFAGSAARPDASNENSSNTDPHIWLNPLNVQHMVNALRDELIAIAPSSTQEFTLSASTMIAKLKAFDKQQKNRWERAPNRSFVSLHDATHYFENHYQLMSQGSLFADTHTAPGVQQLKRMKAIIDTEGVGCVVADPLTPPAWINTLSEGFEVSVVSIDVLGFEPKDANYLTTLSGVADSFAECLSLAAE